MVPVDHWRDNGDGTAWAVISSHAAALSAALVCEQCGGDGLALEGGDDHDCRDCVDGCFVECCDCDGTGRHTFQVEAQTCNLRCDRCGASASLPFGMQCAEHRPEMIVEAHRVHVVPGMVLPIKHPTEPRALPNVVLGSDGLAVVHRADVRYGGTEWATLPAAAKPGMWAVLLQLHEVDR
jgi:hypothetical protein